MRKPSASAIYRTKKNPASPAGGVVNYYVHEAPKESAFRDVATPYLVKKLEAGLPVAELDELQHSLDLPTEKLAPMLGISKATFHRRKGAGEKLESSVSDRVVRFARLLGKAIMVFGEDDARRWLNSPQFGLGGAVPLEFAKTEVGAREVENLLGRIEYGVYS
ncbi:MAG TPA: antitoxin Xre/MbcA/ParS toxin-binding domain-containing protein [Verrucomicrobiae bacterium]|nr:antitoxin Xre/MbcA/ParS toxin-binding domain-containing protein [Verrucomicrobiae bacterium]